MAVDLTKFSGKNLQFALDNFVRDIESLSHEELSQVWGGGTRCAYDFIYEVGVVNRRLAVVCRCEDPGPWPWKFGEEWLSAPTELRDKAAAVEFIRATGVEFVEAAGDDMERIVVDGEASVPVLSRVWFAVIHLTYHDAQLNFIQTMAGDMVYHRDI